MREISRILCPVDFSDESTHAIGYAAVIARWYEAAITALHVYNVAYFPVPGISMDDYQRQPDVDQLKRQVDACLGPARDEGVEVDVRVQTGPTADGILGCADALPADLIVMGTHGIGGFQHLVLGSVAEKVLRRATCPVLTVPPRAQASSVLPFRRILCPVDFASPSRAALSFALSLAQEGEADLTLLHVVEWPSDDLFDEVGVADRSDRERREAQARQALAALVPTQAGNWCRPRVVIGHGKPYAEILGRATEERADLIVMGVHGHKTLELMLFGSTTNQVVRQATCPVLTLRE